MAKEPMDVEAARTGLEEAVRLQYQSVLSMAVAAGGIGDLVYRGLANDLWSFASDELTELRVLLEKLTAMGGTPPAEVPRLDWEETPEGMISRIIRQERECIEALHEIIPATGQEGRSEALEHLLEHAIMRKQRQVDLLARAVGDNEYTDTRA
jgi:bacterioferritin (cytochrome b1)